jgi:hypothetical protein
MEFDRVPGKSLTQSEDGSRGPEDFGRKFSDMVHLTLIGGYDMNSHGLYMKYT